MCSIPHLRSRGRQKRKSAFSFCAQIVLNKNVGRNSVGSKSCGLELFLRWFTEAYGHDNEEQTWKRIESHLQQFQENIGRYKNIEKVPY